MLTIKLSQVGKKNKKMFRLIVNEKGRDPYGQALEILGSYNPHSKKLEAKADRIKHWIEKGAQMTSTINNLLIVNKIITGKKTKSVSLSQKRQEKINKKKEEKKAKEAAPAPVETPVETPAETPAEETPTENKE